MGTATQQWKVGDVTVTSIVEEESWGVPPQFFFPDADAPAGRVVPDEPTGAWRFVPVA